MMESFSDTDRNFCSILFDVISAHGVTDVVCSPGSRNAPLLIAAASRENLRKHVVIDERSAAFMALGIALSSRRPVALVCTSGTALLNYSPAVAEAFYQGIPLIVVSADRPEQWIDQDDSQTIRQFEALSNFVKKSCQLPAWGNDDPELQWYANRVVNDAMIEALTPRRGPVHINVRLGEPLGGKRMRGKFDGRIIERIPSDYIASREVVKQMALELSGRKVMFVAGFMSPDARFHKAASQFCSLPNVVAMTETLSNLHLGNDSCAIDSVLTAFPNEILDKMAPDMVISVGGSLVSRKLKEYLRRNSGKCRHWSLGWNHTTSDCFQSLTRRIEADPSRLLHQFYCCLKERGAAGEDDAGDYGAIWREMKREALRSKGNFVRRSPWCELKALDIILRTLPPDVTLFLSNGTSVRYAQILSEKLPHASFCNRGVSGIDGSVSTAAGYAKASKGRVWLVTGDMSMAYDSGALALRDIPETMRIIVIDNGGGGIFRFIPSTSPLEEREQYFCAPPQLPLRQLSEGYGWDYYEVSDEESLSNQLGAFMFGSRKGIMRVICNGELSAQVLHDYMSLRVENNNN